MIIGKSTEGILLERKQFVYQMEMRCTFKSIAEAEVPSTTEVIECVSAVTELDEELAQKLRIIIWQNLEDAQTLPDNHGSKGSAFTFVRIEYGHGQKGQKVSETFMISKKDLEDYQSGNFLDRCLMRAPVYEKLHSCGFGIDPKVHKCKEVNVPIIGTVIFGVPGSAACDLEHVQAEIQQEKSPYMAA